MIRQRNRRHAGLKDSGTSGTTPMASVATSKRRIVQPILLAQNETCYCCSLQTGMHQSGNKESNASTRACYNPVGIEMSGISSERTTLCHRWRRRRRITGPARLTNSIAAVILGVGTPLFVIRSAQGVDPTTEYLKPSVSSKVKSPLDLAL